MKIVRPSRPRGYAITPTHPISDPELTWEEKGLLWYLLSQPEDQVINNQDLMDATPNGRRTVERLLRQLEDKGYLIRTCKNNDKGQFEWTRIVLEHPEDGANYLDDMGEAGQALDECSDCWPDSRLPETDNRGVMYLDTETLPESIESLVSLGIDSNESIPAQARVHFEDLFKTEEEPAYPHDLPDKTLAYLQEKGIAWPTVLEWEDREILALPGVGKVTFKKIMSRSPNTGLPEQIKWFKNATGCRTIPRVVYPLVIEAVDQRRDYDLAQKVYQTWVALGWNPMNLRGVIDHYKRGVIPGANGRNGKTNGHTPAPKPVLPTAEDAWSAIRADTNLQPDYYRRYVLNGRYTDEWFCEKMGWEKLPWYLESMKEHA